MKTCWEHGSLSEFEKTFQRGVANFDANFVNRSSRPRLRLVRRPSTLFENSVLNYESVSSTSGLETCGLFSLSEKTYACLRTALEHTDGEVAKTLERLETLWPLSSRRGSLPKIETPIYGQGRKATLTFGFSISKEVSPQ